MSEVPNLLAGGVATVHKIESGCYGCFSALER